VLIVVLGVFIGMQVSNWNAERETNQKAKVFSARLTDDLREEDWGYQLLIKYNRQVLVHANRAVGALDGSAPLDDEALLVSAYRATQYKQKLRRRGTYEELISTGTIDLIRDQRLRETAVRLYNSQTIDNMVREGMQSKYREAFRMTLPNAVQRALAKACGDRITRPGDYPAIEHVLDYPCQSGLDPATVHAAAEALRTNPNLVPLLRLRIADIETRISDMTSNNRDIMGDLRRIAGRGP
jgi:phage baseplate assembly protein W